MALAPTVAVAGWCSAGIRQKHVGGLVFISDNLSVCAGVLQDHEQAWLIVSAEGLTMDVAHPSCFIKSHASTT